jgi:hypothetical protein
MSLSLLGLILLSVQPLVMAGGAFYFDYNETHVFNKTWPEHARFHNGQTMSMSIYLGLACLFYTWRTPSLATTTLKKESLLAAVIIGSCYTITGLSATLYPGTLCVDKMFWEGGVDPGCPQHAIFGIPLIINWVGYAIARFAVGGETAVSAKKKI